MGATPDPEVLSERRPPAMSDIFISYARTAEAQAGRISDALTAAGYRVWRDDQLPAHRPYGDVIEERLAAAKAVLVLWSAEAIRSQWVRAEADVARQARKLVQVTLDGLLPPMPFNQVHCLNLDGWMGDADAQVWRHLRSSLDALLAAVAEARPDAVSEAPRRPPPPRLSLVVLPFINLSHDPEQDYFADGVTESLTTDLSRLNGSFVIARNTAFTFKDKAMNATAIGEALNVRYVLEGSVQRGGERLRLSVQLIDAASGGNIWTDRFDKPVTDLFDMQDEIVTRLARALNVQLVAAEARRAEGAAHADSMDFFFMAQAVVNSGFGPNEAVRARALFHQALALDPNNVEALAALALYDPSSISQGLNPESEEVSYSLSEGRAKKAISLAPNHAMAHLALGQVYAFTDRPQLALAEMRRAIELDRNLAHAHAGFAVLRMYTGHAEELEQHVQEALRLSPHDHQAYLWHQILGMAHLCLGQDSEAETPLRRCLEINRDYGVPKLYLAASLWGQGREAEARAAAHDALAINPRFSVTMLKSIRKSTNPTYVSQLARVLENLEKAGIPRG